MVGKRRQGGMSIITLIFILAVLAGVGAIVMKAMPSFLEYQATIKDHAGDGILILVGAPIAAMTLIDRTRQYLKSSVGIAELPSWMSPVAISATSRIARKIAMKRNSFDR